MSETTAVVGDRAICVMCNRPITFVGPYWDHDGEPKPRHPATPDKWGEPKRTERMPDLLASAKDVVNRLDTLPFTSSNGWTSIPDYVLSDFMHRQVETLRAAIATIQGKQ